MEFTDTDEVPRGRKRVAPPPELMEALEDSARRRKSKAIDVRTDQVPVLRRQLATLQIRDLYTVTTRTRPGGRPGYTRFIFRAARKTRTPA